MSRSILPKITLCGIGGQLSVGGNPAVARYRFDSVALEYAQKNYDLFMDDWKTNQHDNEQYHADGGNGGGDTHYSWGALLCLPGINSLAVARAMCGPWRFEIVRPQFFGGSERTRRRRRNGSRNFVPRLAEARR